MSNEELAKRIAKARILRVGSGPIYDIMSAPCDVITDAERYIILAALRPPAPSQERVEALGKWFSSLPGTPGKKEWDELLSIFAADQAAPSSSQNDKALRKAVSKFLTGRMKNFSDSREVDDDLVELSQALCVDAPPPASPDALAAARLAGWEEAREAAAKIADRQLQRSLAMAIRALKPGG